MGNELPTGREWTLRDTLIDNKETSGIFFGPSQRVYFAETTTEPLLDDKLYRLELTLPDGKEGRSTTTMVESSVGAINQPPPNLPNYKMGFAAVNPDGTATYPNFPFKWTTSPGASLYTASLVVHFEERYYADDALTLLDSARDRSVTLSVGNREVNGLNGFQTIDEPFECQRLYGELSTRLEANPRIRRVLGRRCRVPNGARLRLCVAGCEPRFGHLFGRQRDDQQHCPRPADLDQHRGHWQRWPALGRRRACGAPEARWGCTVWDTPSKPSSICRRVT